MIEITDDMVDAAALAFTHKPTYSVYVVARRMLTAALKAHEASKPKPEPVGYYIPNNEPFNRSLVDARYLNEEQLKYEAWKPLYATPPTREPLSDDQVWSAYMKTPVDIDCHVSDLHKFARAIEQAHGIGAKQ